jgi:branched-subunit amino acid aminotransferase/4-amino-4-deoxychorismate lyase
VLGVIWRDGSLLPGPATTAPGSLARGVFTTVGCEDSRPYLWQRHRARLAASLNELGSSDADARLPEEHEVAELLAANGLTRVARVRVMAAWEDSRQRWRVEAAAEACTAAGPAGAPLRLDVVRWPDPLPELSHKVLARQRWERARQEAQGRGGDDALLVDAAGRVLETSIANVFAVLDRTCLTPPAPQCCLPGVMRGWLLTALPRLGLAAEVRELSLDALAGADEVWVTNALLGVGRVGQLDDRCWQRWPWFEHLAQLCVPAPGWSRPGILASC